MEKPYFETYIPAALRTLNDLLYEVNDPELSPLTDLLKDEVIMGTKRKLFEPGDMVSTFTGQVGMVISEEVYSNIRKHLKEGRRPGHYFAPGCCQNPDYVIQVPVLFEDATWDVMRAMNIKRTPKLPEGKQSHIQSIIDEQG